MERFDLILLKFYIYLVDFNVEVKVDSYMELHR